MSGFAQETVRAVVSRAEKTAAAARTFVGEDGLRRCAVCGEPVECTVQAFGAQKLPVICACVKAREEAERRERELRERVEAAGRKARSSPFYDAGYERFTFAADRHKTEDGFREAANLCRSYAARFDELRRIPAGMLLTGPVGTGKSFYASATVNALRDLGVTALIVSTSRLLNVVRANGSRQSVIDELNSFDLVALDDLGAERDTDFAVEQLEAFADARALAEKPLIVTTNLTVNEIRRPSDLRYKRLFDRVNSLCPILVPLVHDSLREAQARERAAKAREFLRRQ